ncbi:MAG: hypothetical protein O7D86_04505 [Proteobacteria bacterium]|nr:hypothetical protein [Pseudomonadota bacterium]
MVIIKPFYISEYKLSYINYRSLFLNTIQTDPSYDFLYWQCRIRQQSVRQGDGRPTPGMCPNIIIDEDTQLGQLVVLIIKQSPEAITAQFQHMVKKTQDPIERWESAIHLLSSAYYQDPKGFSDKMTALLGPGSAVCEKLIEAGKCILNFEQNNQRFSIPCAVVDLQSDDSFYQATFWHNSLFNPSMPGNVNILAFIPDWSESQAETIS